MTKKGKFMVGQANANIAVGYCHCAKHLGYLSQKMLKTKGCAGKQCPYLEKYEEHPYWVRKAMIKEQKKARKKEMRVIMA